MALHKVFASSDQPVERINVKIAHGGESLSVVLHHDDSATRLVLEPTDLDEMAVLVHDLVVTLAR